jgi:hypothetical protein
MVAFSLRKQAGNEISLASLAALWMAIIGTTTDMENDYASLEGRFFTRRYRVQVMDSNLVQRWQ